ncbi:hypothetical protein M8J77_008720 [Diaphorina citri]|nr:hypothetical protein M8J77_008720 [Diaphorina citri]
MVAFQIVEELPDHNYTATTQPDSEPKVPSSLFQNRIPSATGDSKFSRKYLLAKKSLLKPPSGNSPGIPSLLRKSDSGIGSLPCKRPLEESTAETLQCNQIAPDVDKRIFNVVYGKPSAKKHKSWEQDGVLEISGTMAILKDTLGKVIDSKVKVGDLEKYDTGYETHVGSKCVQILDEIKPGTSSLQSSPRLNASDNVQSSTVNAQTSSVNAQTSSVSASSSLPWRPVKKSRLSLHAKTEVNPLILPKPIVDHQWKHNPSGKPLVDVTVDGFLSRVLKPHQRQGVSFLYERVCDLASLDLEGAILADEMGLGKTLQCIALIWTLLRQGPYGMPVIRKVLIVTPSSLTSNWNDEFKKWLGLTRMCPYHVNQKNKAEDYVYSRVSPVLIISYEMLIRAYQTIVDTEFDLLICDEGHRLKNGKSKLYELMTSLNIRKRILLSGTPLQNDLQEFFYLNDFANPGVLGSLREFRKNFEEPILESRSPNSTEAQKSLGELRSSQLAKRTAGFILRRTSDVQASLLNSKRETLLVCRATPLQQSLYLRCVEYWDARASRDSHLSVTHALRKICNHPGLVQQPDMMEEEGQDDLKSFLSQQWSSLSDNVFSTAQSGKLLLVDSLLRYLKHKAQEKIVLVSYFTLTLDLFEVLCKEMNYACLRLDGSTNVQNRKSIVDQFNDPKSSNFVLLLSARAGGAGLNLIGASRLVLYDSDWNPATDLQAMARIWRHGQQKPVPYLAPLVLYDSDWNPATDLQAMARIWRHGQQKPVHIYRLLTAGTVEEKIFQRQISKADLTQCVIENDLMQTNDLTAKMSLEELKDLFTFEPYTESFVHTSLQCDCDGTGEIPVLKLEEEEEQEEEDSEECFLEVFKKRTTAKDAGNRTKNRQHMLMSWAHYHGDNLNEEVLEMVGLPQTAHSISFMFTHTT